MTSAKDSATAAKTSETNARTSEINAQTAANTATNKAQEAGTSATNAAKSAEDAEYWAKQTQGNAQGGDMLKSIYDTEGEGVVAEAENGIKILEASTENVIDFNTLTEAGVYLVKNGSDGAGTTLNAGVYTSTTTLVYTDVFLRVAHYSHPTAGESVYQYRIYGGAIYDYYRTLSMSTLTWGDWTLIKTPASYVSAGTFASGMSCNTPTAATHLAHKGYVDGMTWAASKITAGTFGGKVRANSTAAASTGEFQVRDIGASTTDLTAGTSTLSTGVIQLVYE